MLKSISYLSVLIGAALLSTSALAQTLNWLLQSNRSQPSFSFMARSLSRPVGIDVATQASCAELSGGRGCQYPCAALKSDSQYVAGVLASIQGPIVLVGHSYTGAR